MDHTKFFNRNGDQRHCQTGTKNCSIQKNICVTWISHTRDIRQKWNVSLRNPAGCSVWNVLKNKQLLTRGEKNISFPIQYFPSRVTDSRTIFPTPLKQLRSHACCVPHIFFDGELWRPDLTCSPEHFYDTSFKATNLILLEGFCGSWI